MTGSAVAAAMPTGFDAIANDPWAALLAALAIAALVGVVGFALRRWTARMRTLRGQLLVITSSGILVAALASWLLADLMILQEDQLRPKSSCWP